MKTIENGDEGITIPKEAREKLSIKDRDFVDFLLTRDGSVKIIKFEFVWNKAMKQIDSLSKNHC